MKKTESVACANAELVTNNDPLQPTSAEKRIFTLRGVEVILDKDLAELYHVETKRLNEQVRRNSERFPPEFMFQLTKEEWDSLRSQNATKNGRGQHTKYAPYAFTEHGVLTMLDKRSPGVEASIHTLQITRQLQLDISRHDAQYPPIPVSIFTKSHDRFLVIDNQVYHIGASLKDLGKKWFAFSKMEETDPDDLISRL